MAEYNGHTLACDYLEALGVPHTSKYTNSRFDGMPFHTVFGLTKLLEEYGVRSEGYYLEDKHELRNLTPPFLAVTPAGIVIVTALSNGEVEYLTQGMPEKIPDDEFFKVWNGNVLVSYPSPDSKEPGYALHSRIDLFMRAKKWVLAFCVAVLFCYFFITRRLYSDISTILLCVIDFLGIYFTYMLVQKSVNIHSRTADRVCGVLQEGGCDSILSMSASKFFGIFGWSEVGFSYFSVSLIAILLFPETLPSLALCNLCCLPFTFWSIWYQKFKAHHWCTLCVCVQASLWLLFFCYLFGGWLRLAFPVKFSFIVLGFTYVAVMLGINAVMPLIEKPDAKEEEK